MSKLINFLLTLALFLAVIITAFWFSHWVNDGKFISEILNSFGYLGILIISFISGFNLVLPVPAISFLPIFLKIGENIWLVLLVVTFGMTLGDGLGYLLGKFGRAIVPPMPTKLRIRLENLQNKYYWGPLGFLFIYAAVAPAPNELIVIPMSLSGYKAKHMMIILFFGNALFNILIAFGFLHLINLVT